MLNDFFTIPFHSIFLKCPFITSVKGGSSYRSSMPTILMKKLAGLPTLYCLQAISLIETFSLIVIWWSRLSCLLCSSADIGNVPNNRYTAEFAVLIGRDCRRFSVPIWKLERVAISYFLDLVFQGHIVILGSRRFCMMFLGSAHLYHELLFLLMSKAFS